MHFRNIPLAVGWRSGEKIGKHVNIKGMLNMKFFLKDMMLVRVRKLKQGW